MFTPRPQTEQWFILHTYINSIKLPVLGTDKNTSERRNAVVVSPISGHTARHRTAQQLLSVPPPPFDLSVLRRTFVIAVSLVVADRLLFSPYVLSSYVCYCRTSIIVAVRVVAARQCRRPLKHRRRYSFSFRLFNWCRILDAFVIICTPSDNTNDSCRSRYRAFLSPAFARCVTLNVNVATRSSVLIVIFLSLTYTSPRRIVATIITSYALPSLSIVVNSRRVVCWVIRALQPHVRTVYYRVREYNKVVW